MEDQELEITEPVSPVRKQKPIPVESEMNEYSELDMFLQGFAQEEVETVIYVYKTSERRNGVNDYCIKLVGEAPDLDEIREKFGPGKYNFMVHVGKAKGKTFRVGISPDMRSTPAAQQNPIMNIKEVIESIKPILEIMRPVPPPAPSQSALMGDMMKEAAGVMGQGLREMMNQSVKASTDMIKRAREYVLPAPEPEYEDEPEEQPKSDMAEIIEAFKDFLPMLTGGVPAGMKKKIVNDPRFVATVADPEKLEKAKAVIIQHAGETTGAAIIKSLGID